MGKAENQPPPGYPTADLSTTEQKKKRFWQRSKPKGDRGFIEGCLFALCCCWMCEMCF